MLKRILTAIFICLSGVVFGAAKLPLVVGSVGIPQQLQVGDWLSLNQTISSTFVNTVGTKAQFNRLDRGFIGAAVVNDGNYWGGGCDPSPPPNGCVNGFTDLDWVGQLQFQQFPGMPGLIGVAFGSDVNYSQFAVEMNNNAIGLAGASVAVFGANQSFNIPAVSNSCTSNCNATPRAGEFLFFNNPPNSTNFTNGSGTYYPFGWGLYIEAHKLMAHAGAVYGAEIEVLNAVDTPASWTPTSFGSNWSVAVDLGCGAGLSNNATQVPYLKPCSSVLSIHANPMPFQTGIVFQKGGINNAGIGGTKPAIVSYYDMSFQWFNDSGLVSLIYSDVLGNFYVQPASGQYLSTTNAVFTGWARLASAVVGSLPAAATAGTGALYLATGVTTCTKNVAITGGGASTCVVYSNGDTWLGA